MTPSPLLMGTEENPAEFEWGFEVIIIFFIFFFFLNFYLFINKFFFKND